MEVDWASGRMERAKAERCERWSDVGELINGIADVVLPYALRGDAYLVG